MNFFYDNLRKFWLHEGSVGSVEIQKSKITLVFKKGFWDLNHVQKKNCKIILTISELNEKNVNSFVNITKNGIFCKKQKDLSMFNKTLSKYEFIIEVDYYSEFERSILLVGKMNNSEFYFKVTDIDYIEYMYDD